MNIFYISKNSFILIFYFLTSCGTKNIYEKIIINDAIHQAVESFDENNIILFDESNKKINYEKN